MTPVPVNVPEASLEWSVLPGIGIVPSGAAVTLNVLVPVANSVGGFGVACAFLKKNAPNKSPQLSLNKSILLTFATAPLLSPTIFAPLVIYPKYCASFASDIVSTLEFLKWQSMNQMEQVLWYQKDQQYMIQLKLMDYLILHQRLV